MSAAPASSDPPADALVDEVSLHVDAPPEAVWDLVSDITRTGEWSPECTGGRWLGRGSGPAVGSRFLGFNRRGWVWWTTPNVVEECERGRVFAFRTLPGRQRWTYRMEPEDAGTRLTQTRDLTGARRRLIRALTVFVGGEERRSEELRAGMRQTLERVKAAAEAQR